MRRERFINLYNQQDASTGDGAFKKHQVKENFWSRLLHEVCGKVFPADFLSDIAIEAYGNMIAFPGNEQLVRQILTILVQQLYGHLQQQKPGSIQIVANQYAGQIVLELKITQKIVSLSEISDFADTVENIKQILHEDHDRFVLKKLMSTQQSIGISLVDTLRVVTL